MDPLSGLVSIVGLLANFVNERRADKQLSAEEFTTWLAENRHTEILTYLEQNGASLIAIRVLLGQSRDELLARLDQLDRRVAAIAIGIGGFAELAFAVRPTAKLSDEALQFLRAFHHSGSSRILDVGSGIENIRYLAPMDTPAHERAKFDFSPDRFFDDDLRTLIDLNLIHVEYYDGKPVYIYTRAAANLVQSLDV